MRFKVGDYVTVQHGPYADQDGIIVKVSKGGYQVRFIDKSVHFFRDEDLELAF